MPALAMRKRARACCRGWFPRGACCERSRLWPGCGRSAASLSSAHRVHECSRLGPGRYAWGSRGLYRRDKTYLLFLTPAFSSLPCAPVTLVSIRWRVPTPWGRPSLPLPAPARHRLPRPAAPSPLRHAGPGQGPDAACQLPGEGADERALGHARVPGHHGDRGLWLRQLDRRPQLGASPPQSAAAFPPHSRGMMMSTASSG